MHKKRGRTHKARALERWHLDVWSHWYDMKWRDAILWDMICMWVNKTLINMIQHDNMQRNKLQLQYLEAHHVCRKFSVLKMYLRTTGLDLQQTEDRDLMTLRPGRHICPHEVMKSKPFKCLTSQWPAVAADFFHFHDSKRIRHTWCSLHFASNFVSGNGAYLGLSALWQKTPEIATQTSKVSGTTGPIMLGSQAHEPMPIKWCH